MDVSELAFPRHLHKALIEPGRPGPSKIVHSVEEALQALKDGWALSPGEARPVEAPSKPGKKAK